MSLEDSPDPAPDPFEVGDKVFNLPPGKANVFMQLPNEDWVIMNKHQHSIYYYVEYKSPNPIHETRGLVTINIIPISRRDELAPKSVG